MAAKLSSDGPSLGTTPATLDFDIVIVGAGIAGINAAYRIQNQGPPGLKYVILESRDSMGGTVSNSLSYCLILQPPKGLTAPTWVESCFGSVTRL